MIFFIKTKTAYEMGISEWSSEVCSSDLIKTMVKKELEFWECLQEFRAPAMTDRDYHLRNDGVWKQTAVSFMDAQAELKKWEAREKELRGSLRSEERRVGKECGSTCRSRRSPGH